MVEADRSVRRRHGGSIPVTPCPSPLTGAATSRFTVAPSPRRPPALAPPALHPAIANQDAGVVVANAQRGGRIG